MMTPAQLADLLLNPLAQSHMELLVENIRVAMTYHKNQVRKASCLVSYSASDDMPILMGVFAALSCSAVSARLSPLHAQALHCKAILRDALRGTPEQPAGLPLSKSNLRLSKTGTSQFEQASNISFIIFSGCQDSQFYPREEDDQQSEWVVNVYPKGVWFQRCLTVYRPPGLEVCCVMQPTTINTCLFHVKHFLFF